MTNTLNQNDNTSRYVKSIAAVFVIFLVAQKISLSNCILQLIGINSYQTIISVALYGILDLIVLYSFIRYTLNQRKTLFLTVVILAVLGSLPHLINFDSHSVMLYIVFSVPVIAASAVIAHSSEGYKDWNDFFIKISPVFFVLAVAYVISIFVIDLNINNVKGRLHLFAEYGYIAWLFIPPAIVLLGNIIYWGKSVKSGIMLWIYYICILLAICYTGLRTGFITVAVTLVMYLIFFKMQKDVGFKKVLLRVVVLSVITVVIFQICTHIVPPSSRLIALQNNVIYEESTHENMEKDQSFNLDDTETGKSQNIDDIYENYIINSDQHRLDTEKMLHDDVKLKKYKYIKPVDEESEELAKNYTWRLDRINLWQAAYKEFSKHKITGNGPKYFITKYDGFFPHDVILELLADYGIVGCALALILFVVLSLRYMIRAIKLKDKNRALFFVFTFAFVPSYLVYTSLYLNLFIEFTVTVIIVDWLYSRKIGKKAK